VRRTDLVFFLSGAAALVYETAWARLLTRVLSSQAEAVALVLAVFMAGLGVGAYLGAFLGARPQRVYAGLELFIGLWAAASPLLLAHVAPLAGLGARVGFAALVLLPPTIAMGATFPVMGRLVLRERAALGAETSGFYGANTLGACAGVVLGVALFMPVFGLAGALQAAALLSVAAALGAWTLPAPAQPVAAPPPARDAPSAPRGALVATFLFGCSGLALEVVLTRVLVTVTGASVYAFAIVLATFLAGIGLGSRQARAWLRVPGSAARVLVRCAAAVPIGALLGLAALRWHLGEADLFTSLGNRTVTGAGAWGQWLFDVVLAGLGLLAPAVAFGAALPACVALAAERAPAAPVERVLARVYGANTAGALLGSLAAGFVLLPGLGARTAVALALVPAFLAGALVLRGAPGAGARAGAALVGVLVLGAWTLLPPGTPGHVRVLYHANGRAESVAVEEVTEASGQRVRSIRINGKVEASTAPVDLRLQYLLGEIPALLHGRVESALVIGLGMGTTAGSLLDVPTLKTLEVFELEPAVAEGARLFADWNHALLDDARVHLRFTDGRHALFTGDARYDLVTADPVHIWTRGSSDLYTLEYFQRMAARLAPGGVASQWISLYELSTADVQVMVATWCAAFAHVQAYLTAYDLALVGSNDGFERSIADASVPPDMAARQAGVGVRDALDLAALQVADDAGLRAWCAAAEPMRDARPVLEFRAPLSFLSGFSVEVLRWAGREEFVDELPPAARARGREVRAALREFLERLPRGLSAAAAWYGERLTRPPG